MKIMADQWNIYFWLEWAVVVFLFLYHLVLLIPPTRRPGFTPLVLVVPTIGLLTLLILSLVRLSFRWPLYPALILVLVDIAFVLIHMRKKPSDPTGVAGVFRLLGAIGMLALSAASLGLIWAFPPAPLRPAVEVAMARVDGWMRLYQSMGGRPLRWRAGYQSVMEDYLVPWTIPRLDETPPVAAPAVVVISQNPIWDYRLLLEDLAQAGFDVWAYEGAVQESRAEDPGWGPPYSWNWLRWPEFLTRLTEDITALWSLPAKPAGFLIARWGEINRLLGALRKTPRALILIGEWTNLEAFRDTEGLKVVVRWGAANLPRLTARTVGVTIAPGVVSRPAGARVAAAAEGMLPIDLSDNSVIRPWLGLPHLQKLGPQAADRYASAREVVKRILQGVLWEGDLSIVRSAQMVLPGGLVVLGSP